MKNLNHIATMAGLLGAGALLIAAAPAYVGTGLETRARTTVYPVSAAFPNRDIDETGFVIGTAGPEKGVGDMHGSILYDVGALQ